MKSYKKYFLAIIAILAFTIVADAKKMRVAFVGDPQVNDSTELAYARRSIYKELLGRKDLDLVIILGDLVNDDVRLFAPTKSTLDSLQCPWFCVPGNHDRDMYGKKKGKILSIDGSVDEKRHRDMATYTKIIGTTDRTFDLGNIRFVLFDDVRGFGRAGYEGGLRDSQKQWLRNILDTAPQEQRIVLCAHIPLSEFSAKDSLNAILAAHPYSLAVTGHTHTTARGNYHISDKDSIEEILAGATCGSFWKGRKNVDGIPNAVMNCGAPRGYYIADFTPDGKYQLTFKTVDSEIEAAAWHNDGRIILNIFGGRSDGEASIRFKGSRGWIRAQHTRETAPEVLAAIAYNETIGGKRPYRDPEYIPLPSYKSPHIWSVKCENAPSEETKAKIRYKDSNMTIKTKVMLRKTDSALGNYRETGDFHTNEHK